MHYEILEEAIARAKADANIASLVSDAVYNNVPKDTPPPYLRVQWSDVEDLPDKTARFSQGVLTFDYWTSSRGDREVHIMMDYLYDEFNNNVLSLSEGSTNLLATSTGYNTFLEGDGLSHHGIMTFNLIIED